MDKSICNEGVSGQPIAYRDRVLPLLRLQVVRVDALALLGVANHDADVFAILNDRVALLQVGQSHLVTDRNIMLGSHVGCCVILSNDAEHAGASLKIFDDDDADIVIWAVNKKLRNFGQVLSPMAECCCEEFSGNNLDRSLI